MLTWIDGQLSALSVLLGFPADQLAMVLCILLNYPLAFLFLGLFGGARSTPAGRTAVALRHLYSMLPTVLFAVWLLGWDVFHSLSSSLVGYALLRMLGPVSPDCGRVMFVYAMAYVSFSHIHRCTS